MVSIDFIPLDYDSFDFEERNYVKIIGRTPSGKRVCLIDEYGSYFWAILKSGISEKKIKELQEKIGKITIKDGPRNSNVIKTHLENKKFLGKEVKAIKIIISNYKDTQRFSEKLKLQEIDKIRELDVNYITRYIIEKQLIPSYWYKLEGEEISNSSEFGGISNNLDCDIVIKAEKITKIENEKQFIPKVLAFDLETDDFEIGKGKILMISLVSEGFKKVLTCKKIPSMPDYVEHYNDEADMLEAFIKYFKKISPDILTGYFSDSFDLPYLKSRCEKLKIKLNIGIDNSIPKFSGGVNPKGRISGITHIDLYQFIETAYSQYLQSETLGLGDVANELLGEKKVVHEFKRSEKMKEEEWRNFFAYNLQDAVLTYKLFMKAWSDMVEFSKLMQEPLFNISRDGMSANVEHYIIHNLYKYNEIAERKPLHDEISQRRSREKYEGAFVLQPIPKLYENIVMFDFTSYWPSIISTFNLSRSTFLGEKQAKDSKSKNALEVDTGKKKYFFLKEKGFFPQMLEEVIKLRKQYKSEYKLHPSPILKARSNAFKLIANASYGYQGFFGARYYCPEASASATAISRKFIKEVIEKAGKSGFKAIYSDTDSICLEMSKKTNSQALEFLKKINSELPGIMELELEDFYKRGIWVTTRKGEFGAKKKYALINHEGKMKIRGFETVRRDWCNLARELQNQVLEKILKEGNEKSALELTKQLIKLIKERKIERKQIIIRTQLKKPLSEYKAITPHVTIARKMLAEGMPVNQGMLIEYYIAESDNKKALKRERAFLPDETKPYDIDYYLKNQVLPAVENIFQVFNINVNDLIEKQTKNQKSLSEF
ncbi:ribonuclease H-like domain-containing protein [Candidatus Pacearchaeota archaeon]|nr:ribonuclease H-like domain-containing protein [Candidatus Pacearchaeota archaeon]